MTMIYPERGNLVYIATKALPSQAGGEQTPGAGMTNDKLAGSDSGSSSEAPASTPANVITSWLPLVLVGVAVFFIWKYV